MKGKKKGFTLIELVITIGIISIVVSLLFLFLITNINNYSLLKTDTELQFHSQYIMNFISNKIMESKNVEVIRMGSASIINAKNEYSITKISLRYGTYNYNCYIFEVRNNKIYYGNSYSHDSANIELGTYVKELKASPYPFGRTFAETDALKITLCLIKNGQEYETEQIIFMRNS